MLSYTIAVIFSIGPESITYWELFSASGRFNLRHTNVELKTSGYVLVHIKRILQNFRILHRKIS